MSDKLKERFTNEFINNITFGDVVRLVAREAEIYAENKVKNPKQFTTPIKEEKKVSLWGKILGFFKKEKVVVKKLASKKVK